MWRYYVDRLETWRKRRLSVGGEGAEKEDEEDETVFTAIVGEGDFFETAVVLMLALILEPLLIIKESRESIYL